MEHYLDNSATTKVTQKAAVKAAFLMTEEYANPSSLHTMGYRAKCEMDKAREVIAQSIMAKDGIYFTSGGTESNNIAILGAVKAKKRFGNKIITTAIEHPSVLEPMKELEKQGFEVIYIKPDESGHISDESIAAQVDEKTILVSIMLVNNEVGTILPVKVAAQAIKRKKAPAFLHCDAVQGYGKIPISVSRLGVDLMTLTGHKVHAPKGIGALYVSKSARILPIIYGGGQEKGLRPGTESIPLIGAFGQAVEEMGNIRGNAEKIRELNLKLRSVLEKIEGIRINTPQDATPYVLNFSVGKIKAETMLHYLAQRGIFVSSGSACGRLKPSHVLEAMGLDKDIISSSIRVSFSRYNTQADIEALLGAVKEGMENLAHE